ncbi:MAG: hypothetical protein OXU23_27725 [Candidatus Poribacteria bacterium]|nr:hypothetical protein [Candidatus Poribacteria bacterium]
MKRKLGFLFFFLCLGCGDRANLDLLYTLTEPVEVFDITPEVREKLKAYHSVYSDTAEQLKIEQKAYYKRYIDAEGITVVGPDLPDWYFIEARRIILVMTSKRPELRETLSGDFYMIIPDPYLPFDIIPEVRASAVGKPRPFAVCNTHVNPIPKSKQVVGWCVGPIWQGNTELFAHEFAHALHTSIRILDSTFDDRLYRAYENAVEDNLWTLHLYVLDNLAFPFSDYYKTNYKEYWAEVVKYWFHRVGHGHYFKTSQEFIEHDPQIGELILKWFPEVSLSQ